MSQRNQTATLHRSYISGTGSYLPEKILTNHDLEKMVDTSHEWIVERTGIHRRHLAAEGELTTDLAYKAASSALEMAGVSASDIEMIVFATVSPDQIMPSASCTLQNKLGCGNCMAMDLSAACSGFVYGLSVADQFIRTGVYRHVLVVGAEILHPLVDFTDRETCILFGDGAGAAVLSRAETEKDGAIHSVHLHADGQLGHLFELPGPGVANPVSQELVDNKLHYVRMKGREIFKNAVRTMTLCCEEALEANQATKDDVDWLIPHQANVRILESVAKYFGIPKERVIVNLDDTGNTSAASIPIALDQAVRSGKIHRGHRILLTAFGAGLTSGSVYLTY